MLQAGLIAEVEQLRKMFELHENLPSMRCVGYRQVWQYLEGEFDQASLLAKGIAATRQLAKRQLTWLRAMTGLKEFDCLAQDLTLQVDRWLAAQLQ
jgi:tRNA dimethylallyltransferase